MQPKTEELLNFLLWSADSLLRPSFRKLNESYEGWVYRNGFHRQVEKLENQRLIQRDPAHDDDRLYRLTAQGRVHALGGRDPEERWNRCWDGQWRLVLFDVPISRNSERAWLRRYLANHGFGCLQGSVWLTPDPIDDQKEILSKGTIHVDSLFLLQGEPCAGEKTDDIVSSAWDWDRINDLYTRHQKIIEEKPKGNLRDEAAAREFHRWAKLEHQTWLRAASFDPMLPKKLLPENYQGCRSLQTRLAVLKKAGEQLQSFTA